MAAASPPGQGCVRPVGAAAPPSTPAWVMGRWGVRSAAPAVSGAHEQLRAEPPREPLGALAHDDVVVPREHGPRDRREPVHPRPRRAHLPLVDRGGPRRARVEPPVADADQLAVRVPSITCGGSRRVTRLVNVRSYGSALRQSAPRAGRCPPRRPRLELDRALDALPPLGPARGVVDRLEDALHRRVQAPRGHEAVVGHGATLSPSSSRSTWSAAASATSSRHGCATTWTPIGSPSGERRPAPSPPASR